MENVMLFVLMIVASCCLLSNLFIGYMIWEYFRSKHTEQPVTVEETPEEKELREKAADAQKAYEQGFVNLMAYDGMPHKGE